MNTIKNFDVACFGETLWDILPHGSFIGGAPLNVAYHLLKLGLRPALISKVGFDQHGQELIDTVDNWGMSTDFFQLDYENSTGKVTATIDGNNDASYVFADPVAWDTINIVPGLEELVSATPFFLYGSLACRKAETRKTLFQLLETANTKLLDINLRQPYYNRETLAELIGRADILKLNIDELQLVTGWFSHYESLHDRLKDLQELFNLDAVILTCGKEGAVFFRGGHITEHKGFRVPVTDTIGSGDAFMAAMIMGLYKKMPDDEMLSFANRLAAGITMREGACPEYTVDEIMNEQLLQPQQ